MTGRKTDAEIKRIARGFAATLDAQDLQDISQALMHTCAMLAATGHCSPEWLDMNRLAIEMGLLALERRPA